jgi:hypothetical protein
VGEGGGEGSGDGDGGGDVGVGEGEGGAFGDSEIACAGQLLSPCCMPGKPLGM